MPTTLLLIWDYDTPTGFDVSHLSRLADPMSDYKATDRILALLAQHGIVTTFACVGAAARSGPLPYHNPAQIRSIHTAGHEIASHSQGHELIPTLTPRQLRETCRASKAELESCIGAEVVGFVPPWNRPFHYPAKLAFSGQDLRDSGGIWKHSIPSLCAVLAECGYRWVRVHYAPFYEQVARFFRPDRRRAVRPTAVGREKGITTFRLSYLGYDRRLIDWLAANHTREQALVLYAHPHGIDHPNSQAWRHLLYFVNWFQDNKARFDLVFSTPSAWLAHDP